MKIIPSIHKLQKQIKIIRVVVIVITIAILINTILCLGTIGYMIYDNKLPQFECYYED
jgi:hypothetical protein